jgi:hypothetical protein
MPITDPPPLSLTTTIRLEDIDPRALSTIGGALSGPMDTDVSTFGNMFAVAIFVCIEQLIVNHVFKSSNAGSNIPPITAQ